MGYETDDNDMITFMVVSSSDVSNLRDSFTWIEHKIVVTGRNGRVTPDVMFECEEP
jgi:hypothetical protein